MIRTFRGKDLFQGLSDRFLDDLTRRNASLQGKDFDRKHLLRWKQEVQA